MVIQGGPHRSVMLREAVDLIRPPHGGVLVDATVGTGGHTEALLEAVGPEGKVYGIDRDPGALDFSRHRLARFGQRFVAIHGDYRDLAALLLDEDVQAVDGVLADLGISSLQLDDPGRGFAFRLDGPLDMRLDRESGPTATDLLATLPEKELAEILYKFGEERRARPVARAIIRERSQRPIRTTRHLAELVERVMGPRSRRYRIHPATRTFQALRIAVNHELEGLNRLITEAVPLLRQDARLVVISFHSLEDRTIKHTFRSLAERCTCPPKLPVCGCGRENFIRIVTPRPLRPTTRETEENVRSRSARLRAAEKL